MLDPRSILLAMPCGDGRMMAETAGMLVSSRYFFAGVTLPSEISIVQMARNTIVDNFLSSPYEWLISMDSDIVARPEDFRLLLEPCDTSAEYWEPGLSEEEQSQLPPGAQPKPSRVLCDQLPVNEKGQPDFSQKIQRSADMLVAAQYSYKNDALEPVQLGFGFVRIHRYVFELLQKLEHPLNPERPKYDSALTSLDQWADEEGYALPREIMEVLERNRPDLGGGPRLWQGSYKGKIITDYFPTGPMLSQFVPNAQWKGEDHGFFTLCHMAGIIPRIETRTRLTHIGRKGYPYMGPGHGGGQ